MDEHTGEEAAARLFAQRVEPLHQQFTTEAESTLPSEMGSAWWQC